MNGGKPRSPRDIQVQRKASYFLIQAQSFGDIVPLYVRGTAYDGHQQDVPGVALQLSGKEPDFLESILSPKPL